MPGRFDRVWHLFLTAFPYLLFLVITLPHIRLMPMWDGRMYYDALMHAVQSGFSLNNFLFYGHPSLLYGLFFGAGQYLVPDSVVILNGMSIGVGFVGICAFARILRQLFPAASIEERMLMTSLFACHPVVASGTVSFNIDFGVMIFMLVALAALFDKRYLLVIAAGTVMVFTKESGVLLYGSLLCAVAFLAVRRGTFVRDLPRTIAPLCIPVALFLAYVLVKIYIMHDLPFTHSYTGIEKMYEGRLLSMFLSFNLLDSNFIASMAAVFLLNFQWVGSLLIAAAVAVRVLKPGAAPPADGDTRQFTLVFLLIAALYLLTRVIPWTITRYFIAVYPLVLLMTFMSVRYLFRPVAVRSAVVAGLGLLSLVSLNHSVDPLSAAYFGTMPFGDERMFTIGLKRGQQCCSPSARDELVYNLQFTNFDSVQETVFRTINPTRETVVESGVGYFNTWDSVRRTRAPATADVEPIYIKDVQTFMASAALPDTAYFMQFPNIDSAGILESIGRSYAVKSVWEVPGTGGHFMHLIEFAKKEVVTVR